MEYKMKIGDIDFSDITVFEWCIFIIFSPFILALFIALFIAAIIQLIHDKGIKILWEILRWQFFGRFQQKKYEWYYSVGLLETGNIMRKK